MLAKTVGGAALAGFIATVACSSAETEEEIEVVDPVDGGRRARRDASDDLAEVMNDASVEAGDGGEARACALANTCATARELGTVSGDVDAQQQTTRGTRSEWLKVRVTEDQAGFAFGATMSVTLSLLSPTGSNFDLFVYFDPDADVSQCTSVHTSSTQQAGIGDSVRLTWGEGAVPNGDDDSRTIAIEVRHVSGPCKPGSAWTLLVEGHK